MILYINSSALVKRYVVEPGTPKVESLLATADLARTALISRAEVSAAICRAVRMGIVDPDNASASVKLSCSLGCLVPAQSRRNSC